MNSTRSDDRDRSGVAPVIGFALGALVGAGLTLLLAPASGEKTRQRLGQLARRVGRGTSDTLAQVRHGASRLGSDAQSAIQAGREAFIHEREARESEAGSKETRGTRQKASDAR